MKIDVTFFGENTYRIGVDSENANFSVSNVSLEALKELRDRLNYVIDMGEAPDEQAKLDVFREYNERVWNPRSQRHEIIDKEQ